MFGWFTKRKDEGFLFHPSERCIFRYFDGSKEVAADPMILYRRWKDCRGDLDRHLTLARSPLIPESWRAEANEAYEKAQALIRGIFDVKTFSEGGLLELECFDLLSALLAFVGEKKKTSNPSPMSSTVTAGSATSSEEGPTTPLISASGSTDSASCTVALTPSTSEPLSPMI